MNYAHIVFLDFDGPLYPERQLLIEENSENNSILKNLCLDSMVTYWKMDSCAIAMLNQLYEIRTYLLVITSSWGDSHTKDKIESLLALNGLNIPLHKNWNLHYDILSKGERIKEWLSRNKIADYMIVDDDESGDDFKNINYLNECCLDGNKIVICSSENGLSMSDYYKMKAIVANWD